MSLRQRILRRRKSKQTPVQNAEPTLEDRVFALMDEGDFLEASNLLNHELGGPLRDAGNAYYEFTDRWRRARGKA